MRRLGIVAVGLALVLGIVAVTLQAPDGATSAAQSVQTPTPRETPAPTAIATVGSETIGVAANCTTNHNNGGAPMALSLLAIVVSILSFGAAAAAVRYSARQRSLASIIEMINWMERMRPARRVLYALRDSGRRYPDWTKEEEKAAYEVSRWFDILGLLDSTGHADRRVVDRFYAIPAKQLWDICKPYVEDQQRREKRGPQHLWEFRRFAERVEHVESNHPANSGRKTWPRWPRCRSRAKLLPPSAAAAQLPPLAGPAGPSGMGSATYAVLAGAAAGVFAFAVLAGLWAKSRRAR